MIAKQEINRISDLYGIHPHIIEKDYVLGWVLAGISYHSETSGNWIFKGGTCLRKCYFETYRFSEDLDFTLREEYQLSRDFLTRAFSDISKWIYQQSRIEITVDSQLFDIYENPRRNKSCQAKLIYRGPVSPRYGDFPRLKLDITASETVVLPPARMPVVHFYSDRPESGFEVLAYSYLEALAEKIRALAERSSPRDLYDIVSLFRNSEARPSATALLDVLVKKCEFKNIQPPRYKDVEANCEHLENRWVPMLKRQLQFVPPVEYYWNTLNDFFTWLHENKKLLQNQSINLTQGDSIVRDITLNLPLQKKVMENIEKIRFAATNWICVDLRFDDTVQRIEPYSLRKTQEDEYILYAWSVKQETLRLFNVAQIQEAFITNESFSPRFEIQLVPKGSTYIKKTQKFYRKLPNICGKSLGSENGQIVYIYQCGFCTKQFRRSIASGEIRKHKAPDGKPCTSRMGYLIETINE